MGTSAVACTRQINFQFELLERQQVQFSHFYLQLLCVFLNVFCSAMRYSTSSSKIKSTPVLLFVTPLTNDRSRLCVSRRNPPSSQEQVSHVCR